MNEQQMTLGADYEGEPPCGWWMSEKLDGCRVYRDGQRFWSRSGNFIKALAWFTKWFPPWLHLARSPRRQRS